MFFGLATSHGPAEMAYAVLEGVAFAIADGQRSLEAAGTRLTDAFLVGGGSRSALWARLLASATGLRLHVPAGGDLGGAFGAARLALLAATGAEPAQVCTVPATAALHEPEPALAEVLHARSARYRDLYQRLREPFREFAGAREAGARPR